MGNLIINLSNLADFLVRAKKKGYAGGGTYKDGPYWKTFEYIKDDLTYKDRYHEDNKEFKGIEVVFVNNLRIWDMEYKGQIIADVNAEDIYDFLKQALLQVEPQKPFRGPREFRNKDLAYYCKSSGFITHFRGMEKIFSAEKKVYELSFHGGLDKKMMEFFELI